MRRFTIYFSVHKMSIFIKTGDNKLSNRVSIFMFSEAEQFKEMIL